MHQSFLKIKTPIKQEGGSPFVSSVFYANIDNDIEKELLILIRWPQRHYDYSGTFYKVYVYDFIKNKDNCRLICQHFIGQKIYNLTNHFKT